MMAQVNDILSQFEKLSPADKSWFIHRAFRRLGEWYDPGVESHPDVCGGSACLVRTRIPVWLLKVMRDQGMTESQILDNYPTLTAEDLVNAWAYIRNHPDEISREIRDNEDA